MIYLKGEEVTVKLVVPYKTNDNSLMVDLEVGWIINLVKTKGEYIVCSSCPWNGYPIGAKELKEHYEIIYTGGDDL